MGETVYEALNRIDDGERDVVVVGPSRSSLDFLQSVYRDPCQPLTRRMRAAIAALPFEHPKLAVTANIGPNAGFALRLEQARKRTGAARLIIDASPVATD